VPGEIAKWLKERFAASGLPPSSRVEILNLSLELGRWLKANPSPAPFDSRQDLYRYIDRGIAGGGPVDYLEFGVYRGDAIRFWSRLNRHPNSRFFGFDTFEGLPEDWKFFTEVIPAGTWETGGKPPELGDARVTFVKGIFRDTLPGFLSGYTPAHRLVINCDADLYTSTLYLLVTLNHLLAAGTTVIFDEFSTVYEFRAFRDFVSSFRRKYRVLASADRFRERVAMEFA
jgi:hypothetical protein